MNVNENGINSPLQLDITQKFFSYILSYQNFQNGSEAKSRPSWQKLHPKSKKISRTVGSACPSSRSSRHYASLAEGTGPVNICANHLLEEDPEEDDEDDEAEEGDIAEVAAPPVSDVQVLTLKRFLKSHTLRRFLLKPLEQSMISSAYFVWTF